MLRHYRRFWIVLASVLLTLPLAITILEPANTAILSDEQRLGAPRPDMPYSVADWLLLPGKLDAYLRDHFGLRRTMVHAQAIIAHLWLRSGNAMVLIGHDGWEFLRIDDMVRQSAGLVVRTSRIQRSIDIIVDVRSVLAAQGIRFLVAPPPNSATIDPDMLPKWARNRNRPTEHDLMLDGLAARGVQTVDLRPPLREARAQGDAYLQYDSHWTSRGALAAFNAIVAADGHPDWRLDPGAVLSPPLPIVGGDLARMLGIEQDVTSRIQVLTLHGGHQQHFGSDWAPTFESVSDRNSGETIMVIGDSFTEGEFAAMVLAHARRFVQYITSTAGSIGNGSTSSGPDEVWWMPTERYMVCAPDRQPKGIPVGNSAQR